MRRGMILWLAATAVLVLGADSASASTPVAKPAWYECVKAAKVGKTYLGDYKSKTCAKSEHVTSDGKYSLVPGVGKGKPFKLSAGDSEVVVVEPAYGNNLEAHCRETSLEGTAVMPNKVVDAKLSLACGNVGPYCSNSGESIVTTKLSGELGWVDRGRNEVGLDLTSESEPESGVMVEFYCNSWFDPVRWKGSVIAVLGGDIETVNKTPKAEYRGGYYLEQEADPCEAGPCKFRVFTDTPSLEGGPLDVIETQVKYGGIEGWIPSYGVDSGIGAYMSGKGEALGIYPEGSD